MPTGLIDSERIVKLEDAMSNLDRKIAAGLLQKQKKPSWRLEIPYC